MRLHLLLFGLSFTAPLLSQVDACTGAWGALNRVKEQIRPDLTDKDHLETMYSTLQAATANCKDIPELWYYRALILDRLTNYYKSLAVSKNKQVAALDKRVADAHAADAAYARSKLPQDFKPAYDPFTKPAAAQITQADFSATVHKKWALVVGINHFKDTHITPLNYAVKDSSDFADFLKDPKGGRFDPSRIRQLKDDAATWTGIREGIGWLRANVQPDDLVVIYFSGHGSPRDMDPNGVSYIMSYDSKLDDSSTLYASSVQMVDLVQDLNREIKAKRVILFLDTCYSGDATGASSPASQSAGSAEGARAIHPVWVALPPPPDAPASASFSGALQIIKTGVGRAVITASRANEQSWENTELKNGYFTRSLLNVLRESQGMRPLGEVFPVVRDQVLSAVTKDHKTSQTPSAEFSDRASTIVLGVPEEN